MNIQKTLISASVFAVLAIITAQASSAQGLPMQDSLGGGVYGISPRTRTTTSRTRSSRTRTNRTPVRVRFNNPGYQVKPRVTNRSRQVASNYNRGTYRNPGYQVRQRVPQKSWKLAWTTTTYRDQYWAMKQRLEAQGYRVVPRTRNIYYQGYRTVQVVDLYCYLYR